MPIKSSICRIEMSGQRNRKSSATYPHRPHIHDGGTRDNGDKQLDIQSIKFTTYAYDTYTYTMDV